MQYHILIATDENATYQAVKNSLENLLPNAIFIKAENGGQAIEAACMANMLHMAFLDVKLPQIDGMQASREIYAVHPVCQFIFLTAYSDFAYMKQTLDIGASNYLLKPFSQIALAIAVQKATSRLERYESSLEVNAQYRLQVEQSHQQACGQALQNILSGQHSCTVIGLQLHRAGIVFQRGACAVLHCQQAAHMNQIGDMLRGGNWPQDSKLFLLEQQDYIFVLLLSSLAKPLAPDLSEQLRSLYTLAQALHDCHLLCAVGSDFTRLEQAETACLHCYSLLRQCTEQQPFQCAAESEPYAGLSDLLLAQNGDSARCDRIQDFLALQALLEIRPELTGTHLYYALVHMLQRCSTPANLTALYEQFSSPLLDCQSTAELTACMREIRCFLLASASQTNSARDSSRQRQDILSYLELHYAEPITLEILSEHLQYSPTYVSKLFKRLFGSSFIGYLTALRLRHAQTLLIQTDLKIKDISVQTGFGTAAYFTSIFRRETGMTPSQYRSGQTQAPPG